MSQGNLVNIAANRLALPAVSRGVWGETSSETVVPPIRIN